MGRLNKADCPPLCEWPSSNQLRPEENKRLTLPQIRGNFSSLTAFRLGYGGSGVVLVFPVYTLKLTH